MQARNPSRGQSAWRPWNTAIYCRQARHSRRPPALAAFGSAKVDAERQFENRADDEETNSADNAAAAQGTKDDAKTCSSQGSIWKASEVAATGDR